MISLSNLVMLVGIIFVVPEISAQGPNPTPKRVSNRDYLGSEASKAYFFPWLVTIHRESHGIKEFFGSGSILTQIWIISSMDSFVRWTGEGIQKPFYQEIEYLTVYSGGVWGTPYLQEDEDTPKWYQKLRVSEIRMFSDTNTRSAHLETFRPYSEPRLLNTFKRSPFGFSMSICLVKVRNAHGHNIGEWIWRRGTLPVPLFDVRAVPIKIRLESEIEHLEEAPYSLQCYVGGWRLEDKRLVQHKVIYVPFEQCETIYCSYDQRACSEWPVKGIHVCFKSLTYDDLCWTDQGSALYCRAVSESAIAILTSGPTCGYGGLPGVYTLIHYALDLYERISPTVPYVPISKEEAQKYTPPPEKDMIPAYR